MHRAKPPVLIHFYDAVRLFYRSRKYMALIEKAKGRREGRPPNGYTRLFGIPELGDLMSRIQATVIAAGNELENLIWGRVTKIDDLASLTKTLNSGEDEIYVARKK